MPQSGDARENQEQEVYEVNEVQKMNFFQQIRDLFQTNNTANTTPLRPSANPSATDPQASFQTGPQTPLLKMAFDVVLDLALSGALPQSGQGGKKAAATAFQTLAQNPEATQQIHQHIQENPGSSQQIIQELTQAPEGQGGPPSPTVGPGGESPAPKPGVTTGDLTQWLNKIQSGEISIRSVPKAIIDQLLSQRLLTEEEYNQLLSQTPGISSTGGTSNMSPGPVQKTPFPGNTNRRFSPEDFANRNWLRR